MRGSNENFLILKGSNNSITVIMVLSLKISFRVRDGKRLSKGRALVVLTCSGKSHTLYELFPEN